MVSQRNKRDLNVALINELTKMIEDICGKRQYLPKYWYLLKYHVHACHAMYRLLFKIILVYGKYMSTKTRSHNLVHGSRPVKYNIKNFDELTYFMSIQLGHIYALVVQKLDIQMQDTIMKLLY